MFEKRRFPDHLIVSVMQFKNFMELEKNEEGNLRISGGVDGRLLNVLSQALHFSYYLTVPTDNEWGRLTGNGQWTGMIGMVNRSEADMAICMISYNKEREEAVHFTEPYTANEITFITAPPGKADRTLAFVYPFDLTVWLCVVASSIIASFVFYFTAKQSHQFIKVISTVYSSIVGQPANESILGKSLFAILWLWTALVISFGYKAVLLSFLAVPQLDTPLRSFQELADAIRKGSYKCLVTKGTTSIPTFLASGRENLMYIAETIENKNWFVSMNDYLHEEMFDGSTAFLGARSVFYFKYGKAPFTTKFVPEETGYSVDSGIAVRKDFCCKDMIDASITRIKRAGLIQKIVSDQLFMSWLLQKKDPVHETDDHPLSIPDTFGALILLAGGLLLSTIVFILEIIHNHVDKLK